jgi:hypothetical protein
VATCDCARLGPGAQLFRVRHPRRHFEEVADFGPSLDAMIRGRRVWKCRRCGGLFALLRLPFRDEEEILVRMHAPDWTSWDWPALANRAEALRWRGPDVEPRELL